MGSIWDLSTTAGSNTSIAGINLAPGGPASSVGPAFREYFAEVKGALLPLAAVGTVDAITATATPAPAGLVDGMRVWVRVSGANTLTNPTFQLNALGTVGTIKKLGGTALIAGDISGAGHAIELEYVSSDNHWELLNPAGVAHASLADNLSALPIASIWTTGDVKITLKTAADAGWVMFNDGTIGDASSGGTARANADTSALFTLLWTNTADADCPVSSGRGASAAADFAAHKTIALPKVLGRALAVAGAGSGLTARALAHVLGEETHTMTPSELVPHVHGIHADGSTTNAGLNIRAGQNNDETINTQSAGSGTPFNVMQPTSFLNVMIKL